MLKLMYVRTYVHVYLLYPDDVSSTTMEVMIINHLETVLEGISGTYVNMYQFCM